MQNFCHLTHIDEYLLMVLFLHEDRNIFWVSFGKLQHSSAEWRSAEQLETNVSPIDVFPGVSEATKEIFGDHDHLFCDTHYIGEPTLGAPFGNNYDPRSCILDNLCNCASYDAEGRKSIEIDICP